MLQKISVLKKCSFHLSIHHRILEKYHNFLEKNYAVFNIDNNKKCFLNTN